MAREFYLGAGEYASWPHIDNPMGLTYADVNIVPQLSTIESRANVDTSVTFGPYNLTVPVVAAPMDTASGDEMIRALASLGALGTMPRTSDPERFAKNLALTEEYAGNNIPCLYAVGLRDGLEQSQQLQQRGAEVVLIDVANGGQQTVFDLAKQIKDETGLTVMAGNIATYDQAKAYTDAGIDMARVGIGGGAVCTTREKTGVGIGQLSAVMDTAAAGGFVIADGGLKTPGDIAKALVAGGEVVMIGSMLAGTDEAPGKLKKKNGVPMKQYRGQASRSYMKDNGSAVTANRTPEGVTTWIAAKGPVKNVIHDITGGLRSSMSYAGAVDLREFRNHAKFAYASHAVQIEARPHAKRTTHKK